MFYFFHAREGCCYIHRRREERFSFSLSGEGREEDVGDGVEGQVWRPRGEREEEGGRVLRQPLGHSRRKKASRSRARPRSVRWLETLRSLRFFSS